MEVEDLKKEIESLKAALLEATEKMKTGAATSGSKEDDPSAKPEESAAKVTMKPVYISPGRRLEVFQGKPTRPTDPSARDWAASMRAQLELRGMSSKDGAAFVKEHLAGDARREILGRGKVVSEDPAQILDILVKVFGDGNTLPQLQQQFYSFQQGNGQDILGCSLQLLEIFDRIVDLDPTQDAHRESALKGRFAEAVRDEALRRELRRLNIDHTELSFFELRDRALQWLGPTTQKPKEATVKAISTDDDILGLIKKQMEQQQKQLSDLQSMVTRRRRPLSEIRCYNCQEKGHMIRSCPHPKRQPPAEKDSQKATGKDLNE